MPSMILAVTWGALTVGAAEGDLATVQVQQVHHSDSFDVWCVSPNVRVFRDTALARQPVSALVRLRAARGECEPMQIAIRSKRKLEGLSLRFPDAGAGANVRLRWNPIGFIDVAQTSTRRTLGKGAYPDALLNSDTFDIEAQLNCLLWVTARVPDGAKPGEHRGIVSVHQGDGELLRFQFALDVWDFALPREMPLVIQGNFWCRGSWIRRYTDRDLREVAKEYFVNMAEHRINACPAIWPFPVFAPEEKFEDKAEELREFEDMAKFVLDELGFKRFRFPYGSAAGGMATGAWRGHDVMAIPAEPGDIWLSGTRVKKRHLTSSFPGARWMASWGMRLMLGQVPDASAFNGSWVEYEFSTTQSGSYRCWLEGRYRCPLEVAVDGRRMGTVAAGGEGFRQAPEPVALDAGPHRLRLTVTQARAGQAAYVRRIFLSSRPDADPAELFQRRRANKAFLRAYAHHLRTVGRYLEDKGWLAKAHLKIGDEPQDQAYPIVRDTALAARQALPKAKTELTLAFKPEFEGLIDIWVPYATHFEESVARQRQRKGEEVWLYYNELHGIDCPALCMRAIPWLLWKFDLDGYHFWSINCWPLDPWTTPVSYTCNCYNRGVFVYPDPKDGSPVNSTRWELFREGLEDYLYLHLAKKRIEEWAGVRKPDDVRRQLRDEMERNLALWSDVLVRSLSRWCEDGPRMARARACLGVLLHQAAQVDQRCPAENVRAALAEVSRVRVALSQRTPGEQAWLSGRDFERCSVAGPAPVEWMRHTTGAAMKTPSSSAAANPYNGSWVEYDLVLKPGQYRIWLRICQHQESETKDAYVDGERIGSVHSEPKGKAHTEFKPVPGVAELSGGKHTLRIVCRGIVGWIDPIQWIYVTSDLRIDPREFQTDHRPVTTPRKPRALGATRAR